MPEVAHMNVAGPYWWHVRWWLGAIRQQAITWANNNLDICRHLTSLGHDELRAECVGSIEYLCIDFVLNRPWSGEYGERCVRISKGY